MEAPDLTLARLSSHLRKSAPRYYPELGGAELRVECFGVREGPLSRIYRLGLSSGELERRLVAKLPPACAKRRSAPDPEAARPRVTPLQDPAAKHRSEHDALRAVAQHFEKLGDARFGAVRMLDFVPGMQALLMEEVPGRPLTQRIARVHGLGLVRSLPSLASIFERTGAWLRSYHDLAPLAHTRTINTTREGFVDCVHRLAGFLAAAHPPGRVLSAAAERAAALASTWLPPELPLGTSHGDLAPRNVIAGPGGRVTVLDTRAAWRAPIYEDLAYFLTAAKTPRAQAASLGLALGRGALGRLEGAFLGGYFGDEPIPLERIRLFELQALLDKWAARTDDRPPTRGIKRLVGAYRNWSVDRLLHRSVVGVLGRFESPRATA